VKTLDTEQIIEIERRLQDEKVKINDDPEEKTEEKKLEEYLENKLEELFKDKLKIKKKRIVKENTERKGRAEREDQEVRYIAGPRYMVCIRKLHSSELELRKTEIYGILNMMRGWHKLDRSKIDFKDVLKELYKRYDFHVYNGGAASLFLGFVEFEHHVEGNINEFKKNPRKYGEPHSLYTFPEYFEHYVVTPMEFLFVIDAIAERYAGMILEAAEDYSKSPEVIKRFFEDSREYSNIAFMRARPIWEIARDGEEKLGTREKMAQVEAGMSTLIRAIQQDAQIRIAIVFGILGVSSVGGLIWQVTQNLFIVIIGVGFALLLCIAIIGLKAVVSTLARTVSPLLRKNVAKRAPRS
jgi:uncharacterized protein YfbU (UPF0304 family)